ncbi:hypothetical protein JXB41_05535 [Candidatus Woesearchaeota archaeon]|nr:hypothetical protein [Candidatus Woesearchaeota archaeon]
MRKVYIIATVVALLVVGIIFVSATRTSEEPINEGTGNTGICRTELPEKQICGASTCNQQCGGSCGIPGCGCAAA